MLDWLRKKFTMREVQKLREEFTALSADQHLFITDVLTTLEERMSKLSKRLQSRSKREEAKEEDKGKFDDGLNELRVLAIE